MEHQSHSTHRYLAIVRRFGINIHSGQVVRFLYPSVSVDTRQVHNLLPGTFQGRSLV